MTKVIAIANHKGGVGKTTTTANLAAALARAGKRVIMVDMDAQANLTSMYLPPDKRTGVTTTYDTLTANKPLPQIALTDNLYLSPASLELARADLVLATKTARESRLQTALEHVKHQYDYVIIDCPPSLGLLVINALIAADEVIITMTPEALSLEGIIALEDVIREVNQITGHLTISGVVITRYDKRKNLHKLIARTISAQYGNIAYNTIIHASISLAEAPLYGRNIYGYSGKSRGADDYTALADEFLSRHNQQ